MNMEFEWKEEYSVANQEIDSQHKRLFALINALTERSSDKSCKQAIMSLFKYTREHFSSEEEMMTRIGFPLLSEHKELHDDLITQLSEISSKPIDTDEAMVGLRLFVFNWLVNHIMKEDNKYFKFTKNQS